jgi:MFS transporter, DHA1 family, tetracycline resistance protein
MSARDSAVEVSAEAQTPGSDASARPEGRQVQVLLLTVFVAFLGQMTLNPIIAPLAKQMGLEPWQIGATISTAAAMLVFTSQAWGKASQSRGRKAILVAALSLALAAMSGFVLVALLGMRGLVVGTGLFAMVLLLRGAAYGIAISAIGPVAQAWVADITTDEQSRIKGMAALGSAQGAASIGGAIVGGTLSLFGLVAPLVVVPLLLLLALGVVVFGLRAQPVTDMVAQPQAVRPTDPRVWPWLIAGFGLYLAFGSIQVVVGFLIQDRYQLEASAAAALTGVAMLIAGLMMVVAQMVAVPRLKSTPVGLLRYGSLALAAGIALLIPVAVLPLVFVAMALIGVGLGLAMPGYTAGPTLAVNRDEQGGLAGLIGATTGLTFVISPVLSTALYGVWAPLPMVVGLVIAAAVFWFVLVSRRLARQGGLLSSDSLPTP